MKYSKAYQYSFLPKYCANNSSSNLCQSPICTVFCAINYANVDCASFCLHLLWLHKENIYLIVLLRYVQPCPCLHVCCPSMLLEWHEAIIKLWMRQKGARTASVHGVSAILGKVGFTKEVIKLQMDVAFLLLELQTIANIVPACISTTSLSVVSLCLSFCEAPCFQK